MTSPNGFQNRINVGLPPAAPGKWAGANIRASAVGGPGQFVAPISGTNVGVMGWADPAFGICSNYFRSNSRLCFIGEALNALITDFLGAATTLIPKGMEVTPFARGDFWGLFASGATPGQKVYADPVTGALTAAATGNSATASVTAPGAVIASGVLTITEADLTGTVTNGMIVVGGTVPPGTFTTNFVDGGTTDTVTLVNVDGLPIPDMAASTSALTFIGKQETIYTVESVVTADASMTSVAIAAPVVPAFDAVMTVTTVTGTLVPGQFISSSGIPVSSNAQILQQLSGTTGGGGGATYLVSNVPGAITGQTITATQGKLGKLSGW